MTDTDSERTFEPGTVFELMVNHDKWSVLTPDLQKIVEVTAAATSEWIYAQMEYHNQQALAELRQRDNVEILNFPPDVLKELRRVTAETLEQEAVANPDFKRVYDHYEMFRSGYQNWSALSDEAYQDSLRQK